MKQRYQVLVFHHHAVSNAEICDPMSASEYFHMMSTMPKIELDFRW